MSLSPRVRWARNCGLAPPSSCLAFRPTSWQSDTRHSEMFVVAGQGKLGSGCSKQARCSSSSIHWNRFSSLDFRSAASIRWSPARSSASLLPPRCVKWSGRAATAIGGLSRSFAERSSGPSRLATPPWRISPWTLGTVISLTLPASFAPLPVSHRFSTGLHLRSTRIMFRSAFPGISSEAGRSISFKTPRPKNETSRGLVHSKGLRMKIHELFAYLHLKGAAKAIEFYTQVFGAKEKFRLVEPSGRIGHAELDFGGSTLMLADEFPEYNIKGPQTAGATTVTI